ncbi:maestro heat-like repeat-containing protein family member 7 [Mauremys mutica]|uniref:maestro heat-like repeat-containing protein family member 7 n=1 Tax=Mauremys mutica TaxID=74926 RepID=UPI001D16B7CC|nr:maestro heat-like repeat-containing protein family member 7 [Mauremys mutica]
MDFLLVAIDGVSDSSVHDAVTARNMLHMILEVPGLGLVRVSEAVRSIHNHLDSISEPLARQELLRALLLLGSQFSEEVVRTLLGCSLSCDSVAAEMWKILTSQPKSTEKILRELVSRLQGQAPRQHHLSQRPAGVASLAVTTDALAASTSIQPLTCAAAVQETRLGNSSQYWKTRKVPGSVPLQLILLGDCQIPKVNPSGAADLKRSILLLNAHKVRNPD